MVQEEYRMREEIRQGIPVTHMFTATKRRSSIRENLSLEEVDGNKTESRVLLRARARSEVEVKVDKGVIAWEVLNSEQRSALDAATEGCNLCEVEQCDGTVGYGGSPDENGETTLDAMIFDGDTMNMGAVGGIRRIKGAAATARRVLENTQHSILVGSLATDFARSMGLKEENLSTEESINMWNEWKNDKCQPNFWDNVIPDSSKQCGPYNPILDENSLNYQTKRGETKSNIHDTISMVVIDDSGKIVVGTSSNGAKYKIPGRVGDAPLPGAGGYADSNVGAGIATGDGDVMMRFLPSFLMVEMMRNGASPKVAATEAITRIAKYYPEFEGAVIAVEKKGRFYAACHGISEFPFSVVTTDSTEAKVHTVKCIM